MFPICANTLAAEQTADNSVRTVRFMAYCLLGCRQSFRSLSQLRDHIKNEQHLLQSAGRHREILTFRYPQNLFSNRMPHADAGVREFAPDSSP
jgi:hypothetical protein